MYGILNPSNNKKKKKPNQRKPIIVTVVRSPSERTSMVTDLCSPCSLLQFRLSLLSLLGRQASELPWLLLFVPPARFYSFADHHCRRQVSKLQQLDRANWASESSSEIGYHEVLVTRCYKGAHCKAMTNDEVLGQCSTINIVAKKLLINISKNIFKEIISFGAKKNLPMFGFNNVAIMWLTISKQFNFLLNAMFINLFCIQTT
jgi:hypothetical protein